MRARTQPSLEAAATLLDRVMEEDPGFAAAYAQRAVTEMLLSDDQYGPIPNNVTRDNAKPWVDRALELGPDLAESWAALGLYWEHSERISERSEAIEPLQRALEINPNLTDASNWLSGAYATMGELQKSITLFEDMVDRDPLYRPAIQNLSRRYFANGRTEDARKLLEKVRPYFTNEAWIKAIEADQLRWEGKLAEALALSRSASEAFPNDASSRFYYELNLWNMHAYDELLEIDTRFFKAASLAAVGRTEEATILAYKDAASGEFGGLINLLGRGRRHAELVEFIESRWGNLDAFQEDSPGLMGFGYMQMALIAHAYRTTEDEAGFQDAMERLDKVLKHLRAEGADNPPLLWSEAYQAMLKGDETTALDKMELILERGVGLDPNIARAFPVFEALRGEERFEAIQTGMRQRINDYREQADLPSLEEASI